MAKPFSFLRRKKKPGYPLRFFATWGAERIVSPSDGSAITILGRAKVQRNRRCIEPGWRGPLEPPWTERREIPGIESRDVVVRSGGRAKAVHPQLGEAAVAPHGGIW